MESLLGNPWTRDAAVVVGVWVTFRLLGAAAFSLREVLVAALLVGILHLGGSGILQHGAAGPYIAQFVDLCSEYSSVERCRCAREELERRMSDRDFADFAFKFYVDRTPSARLREALSGCT